MQVVSMQSGAFASTATGPGCGDDEGRLTMSSFDLREGLARTFDFAPQASRTWRGVMQVGHKLRPLLGGDGCAGGGADQRGCLVWLGVP